MVIKSFIKDNRGQVLYAAIVAVMFIGMLSMLTLGLTLRNYQAAAQKQQRVTDYYAADAVAELIRIGSYETDEQKGIVQFEWEAQVIELKKSEEITEYTITRGTVTIVAEIDTQAKQFRSWEVSYHAVETETQAEQQEPPIE